MRKKSRRIKRNEKKKFDNLKNKSDLNYFKKDIPIIDQLKEELGENKISELLQDKQLVLDINSESKINKEKYKINKEKKFNKDAIENNDFIDEKIAKEKDPNTYDENLKKIFPKANKISELYETYDEYEENLEIMELMKEKNDSENLENNYEDEDNLKKIKEEETNIFLHEYE